MGCRCRSHPPAPGPAPGGTEPGAGATPIVAAYTTREANLHLDGEPAAGPRAKPFDRGAREGGVTAVR